MELRLTYDYEYDVFHVLKYQIVLLYLLVQDPTT